MHHTISFHRLTALLVAASISLTAGFSTSRADVLQPSAAPYQISGDIVANKDISAITRGAGDAGIIASDEGAAIQILQFAPDGNSATVTRTLVLDPSNPEMDFEGAAYMAGWYYVTGSHGVAKKSGDYQERRARVYRFRLANAQAAPTDIQSASLGPILAGDPTLAPYHRKPLQQKGINIEGLAATGGLLYFGLRNPNLNGDAFVLRVDAEQLFKDLKPSYQVLHVPLGPGLGIRAMDNFREGFLIVAGNAGSEASKDQPTTVDYDPDRASELFYWRPDTNAVTQLGVFPKIEKGKEEAILVLSQIPAAPNDIVILYDSLRGGQPTRFTLPAIP